MVANEYICNDCHYDPGCEPSRWRVVVVTGVRAKPNNVFNGTNKPAMTVPYGGSHSRPTNTHISGPNPGRTTFNGADVEKAAINFWIRDEVEENKVTPGNDIVTLKGDRQRKLIQEAKERKPFSLESLETSFEDFMKGHKKISSGFDEVFKDYLRSVGYNFKKNSISCREESKHKDAYNYFLYRQKNLTL